MRRNIIGLPGYIAWPIFILAIALPTVLLEIRSWNTACVEGERVRRDSVASRIRAASNIRREIDISNQRGQEALRRVEPKATAEEAQTAINKALGVHDFGVGFVYANGSITVVAKTEKAEDLDLEQASLAADPVIRELAKGHDAMFSASGVTFTTEELNSVHIRKLESGVEIGWIVDARTIENGARRLLSSDLAIERLTNDPPSDGNAHLSRETFRGPDGHKVTVELPTSAPGPTFTEEDLTTITVTAGLKYRIVLKDPAQLEFRVVGTRRGVMMFSSACIWSLVGFAAALFWRARKAQQLADLRTDFVAAVSHELRTPLASVRMFAELLEAGEVPEDERAEVEQALAGETRRLHATLDRMLRFGALARGKLVLNKEKRLLAPILTEAAGKRDVTIDVDPDLEATVDAGMLQLAIENLLSNATKYAPDGGPYVVRAKADGHDVVISVSDRGPGISSKAQRKIFSPFERADARLSKATEGSGVGLALVRGIAEAHGGEATVQSELGNGATFSLRLPRT
jgi:two-component system phosphate regulon sensor histidine kinase PhoR